MEEVAFHFSLQYPINLKGMSVSKTSFDFVIGKNYIFIFDVVTVAIERSSSYYSFQTAMILVVVWSANDVGSALQSLVAWVNLSNNDTYR